MADGGPSPPAARTDSAMRILHFSDLHLGLGLRHVPARDWLGKRPVGALNLIRGRARRTADARRKIQALADLRDDLDIDLVICTGDYTHLGTDAELRAARQEVERLVRAPAGFITVPGNHDLYAPDTVRERRFERHFGDLLQTDLPEYQVDDVWPLARLVGGDVAVVALNSARPNRPPWRSSGRIPPIQLEALGRLLRDERVRSRFVIIATHYAPRRSDGRPDRIPHRLVNAEEFLAICADLPRGVIVCGHIHDCFRLQLRDVRPAIYCAGSATVQGREGLWVFRIRGGDLLAQRGGWDGRRYVLSPPEESLAKGAR